MEMEEDILLATSTQKPSCGKCGSPYAALYPFWCFRPKDNPTIGSNSLTIPIYRFVAPLCSNCTQRARRRLTIILLSAALIALVGGLALAVESGALHQPSEAELDAESEAENSRGCFFMGLGGIIAFLVPLVIFAAIISGEVSTARTASRLAAKVRKVDLEKDGYSGFWPKEPEIITFVRGRTGQSINVKFKL
jgi:hypothetical protein